MGCDIHLHIEIKVRGKWLHYNHPQIDRHYKLFGKMADVRNYKGSGIKPLSEPKGILDNMTETTAYDLEYWKEDAHSHSWLSIDEIGKLTQWIREQEWYDKIYQEHKIFGYLFGNEFTSVNVSYQPDGLEDVRFIFWFDN